MTNPIRKPGDPGHPVDLMDALHDPVHEEQGLHPNPRWGPSRSRMSKTKRVRIAVAFNRAENPWVATIFGEESPAEALERDFGPIEPPIRITIIEADVPLPEEPAVVRGEVVDG